MEKPISLIIDDLRNEFTDSINKSGLPMCIVRPIISDLLNSVSAAEKQELILWKEKYKEALDENPDTKDES